MKQTDVISSPTCFGYCLSIIRKLHCAWLKLRMSLYVEIVQRQGLAVICRQVMDIRMSFYLIILCTVSTYKDIRNFNHAQCNFLMMDTQYPKHVGEEMTSVCFMF
jgi:hypothetical protein